MRYTANQSVIGNELGLADWECELKTQFVLPAISTRFQCDFDKCKNVWDSVAQKYQIAIRIKSFQWLMCEQYTNVLFYTMLTF